MGLIHIQEGAMRHLIYAALAVSLLIGISTPTAQAEDPAICLKACIEQNGADQKKSCALQCGYGSGAAIGGQKKVDCGIQYKRCLSNCTPTDKDCRKQCRQQRTSCI